MFDDFTGNIDPRWSQTCIGTGTLHNAASTLRMSLPSARMGEYSDAQIDDYAGRSRANFPWKPPLYMEVRARSSHPAATAQSTVESSNILHGTAGFGFWNYPFSVRGDILMLPESIWFFYASPPSNMALVPDVPGWGWKAQVIHSMRAGALAATAPMAITSVWARLTGETRPAALWLQRMSGASEAILNIAMDEWHTYRIEWQHDKVMFRVNDLLIHTVLHPPSRPLGFVAWLDNQYAVATPRGVLRFGTVASGPQWFELDSVMIERQ
ncbi:MAG: hypothetical protein ABI406_15190 [Ktedonobacteraceae bacterium]